MIDRFEFWRIIDEARNSTTKVTDIPAWLTNFLRDKSVEDIRDFEDQKCELKTKAYDARLWAAAGIMLDFCSDDKFQDFRGWLIAQGKVAYESVIENPDALADLDHKSGDHGKPILFKFSYAPTTAYREKTGLDDIPLDYKKYRNAPLLNKELWDGDVTKLPTMFPKLYAKFGRQIL
jgi:hypothetical protein